MLKVMVVDDQALVRRGFAMVLGHEPDIEVVAEASDGREAVLAVRKEKPDVAVIDISMPILDGLEVITQLKSEFPEVPILVLTMHEEHQYVVRAIETGAMGYITKQSAPEQLVKAIRKVHSGSLFLTDEAAEALALRVAKGNKAQSPLDSLSSRELQVLRRLALGNNNREIASAYHISIKTVDTYRFRLLKKLNLRNNADLSRFAIQNHLIET